MNKKYFFKRLSEEHDKMLICPACFETLLRTDIEHYKRCPYCNYKIEFTVEIEDYILKPTVDRWVTIQNLTSHLGINTGLHLQ